MLHIYDLIIEKDDFDSDAARLLNDISRQRQQKTMRYRFPADRLLCMYGELLTRMAISNITGVHPTEVMIATASNKKPFLTYPEGLHFNISHTKNCVLCAVSDSGAVGVDIEKLAVPPYNIMKNAFHDDEQDLIHTCSVNDKARNFYRIWTRKEALLKRDGRGITTNLTKINTLSYPEYHEYEYHNYICSICAKDYNDYTLTHLTEQDVIDFFHSEII